MQNNTNEKTGNLSVIRKNRKSGTEQKSKMCTSKYFTQQNGNEGGADKPTAADG